jgi:ankyrin repeat protein
MSDELYNICREASFIKERLSDIIQWLEENKEDEEFVEEAAYFQDENAVTALHYLLRANPPVDLVRQWLDFAPYAPTAQSTCGWLPLHVSLMTSASPDVVKLLLRSYPKGAKVQNVQGQLPIHLAVGAGSSLELIDLLLSSYPESVNIKDKNGNLPSTCWKIQTELTNSNDHLLLLHQAITCEYSIPLVQFLLSSFPESCMKQDEYGMVPLHYACASTALQALEYIVELLHVNKSCLVVKDNHGRIPLQIMKHNKLFTKSESPPLHYLVAKVVNLSEESLQLFLDAYPDSAMTKDKYGMLPFHHACLNPFSSLEVLMVFINMNPEIVSSYQDSSGHRLSKKARWDRRVKV